MRYWSLEIYYRILEKMIRTIAERENCYSEDFEERYGISWKLLHDINGALRGEEE